MVTRCFWPESLTPRSPMTVSRPSGMRSENSCEGAAGVLDLLLRGFGAREEEVLADRAVEEEVVLEDEAELAAVGGELDRAQVDAVHEDAALVGLEEETARDARVDLPEPELPTRATTVPGSTSKSMPRRTGSPST